MKTIVFTGGPCSGKTRLIKELRKKLRNIGYSIITTREASRQVLKEGQFHPSEDPLQFQIQASTRHLSKESRARRKKCFSFLLLDRGFYDGAAYSRFYGANSLSPLWNKVVQYDLILLLEQLPYYEQDGIRTESPEEGKELFHFLYKEYENRGFLVEVIPVDSIENRVKFVLKIIKETFFS